MLIECNCYLVLLGSYFLGDNRCLIVYGVEEVKAFDTAGLAKDKFSHGYCE